MKVGTILSGVLIAAMLLAGGCAGNDRLGAGPSTRVVLNIKDRAWDPNRPDKDIGWCGEACIQMAMAHYGREVSQTAINRAAGGGVAIPEITTENMDVALRAFRVGYLAWDSSNRDIDTFIEWIKASLRNGHPVICGIKVYPDEHPDWSVDHFVLAVGFDKDGIVLNAQPEFGGQQRISYTDLKTMNKADEAISFQSVHRQFFARAITGLR